MAKLVLRAVLTIIAAAAWATAQPRFETATFQTATVVQPRGPRGVNDGVRYEISGANLPTLIRRAYRLEPYQTISGPDWIGRRYYDIQATLPKGATKDQIPEMLRALLEERIGLVIRRENREEPLCILTVAKNGPKLKPSAPDADPNAWVPSTEKKIPYLRVNTPDGILTYSHVNGYTTLDSNKMTMADLADALRKEVNMPVLDHTGLKGFYEVSLFVPGNTMRTIPDMPGWRPPARAQRGDTAASDADPFTASDPTGVNIFTSVGKIGLKLVKTKGPIEHLVVEQAEQIPKAQ